MLVIEMPPLTVMHPQCDNQVGECAHCHSKFKFKDGVLLRLHQKTNEIATDDGEAYHVPRVKLHVFHTLECFTALAPIEGRC